MSHPNKLASLVEPPVSPDRLERQYAGLQARESRAKKRRHQYVVAGTIVAAASIVLSVLGVLWNSPATAPAVSSSVPNDDRKLELPGGATLTLGKQAKVRLLAGPPEPTRVALDRGKVRFRVPAREGERFVVECERFRVIVVGTEFEISRRDEAEDVTVHVQVRSGEVRIEETGRVVASLVAGQSWSSVSARRAATLASPSEPSRPERPLDDRSTEVAPNAASPTTAPGRTATPSESAPSDEPEGSPARQLFEAADLARREGRFRDAARAFNQARAMRNDAYAGIAAFELGRLRLDVFGDARAAAEALRDALSLSAGAPFAEHAIARLVEAYEKSGQMQQCTQMRARYLRTYPKGVHRTAVEQRCAPP